jgi:hypothetical protein
MKWIEMEVRLYFFLKVLFRKKNIFLLKCLLCLPAL